jgi:N-carbamoylputrescine amidase
MIEAPSHVTVGLVQQACTQDRNHNLAASITYIEQAAARGAQLVVLQELHTGPYFCQTEKVNLFDLAEPIPGPSTRELSDIARALNIVIVASLFEKRAKGLYHNTAVVIERNGEIAGTYRKMHIPDDPGYYEKFYFTPGDLGFTPIPTSVGKLGILVCWDQWYPEAARLMALAGADLLLYPTAIGWGSEENCAQEKNRQRDAWITIQRSHAIANGLPVIVCNRIGFEPAHATGAEGIAFWGTSFITGPQGELLAKASEDQADVLVTDINLQRTEAIRRAWPFLRDRRIDAYQGLVKRFLS